MSRIIVKNLPKHATEARLKEHFSAIGEVTDCRLKKTKDGKTRQFAFVGFRNDTDAKQAVKELNRSFLDTAKISVELAHAPGSEELARPWSKYAAGSSAHEKRNPGQSKQAKPKATTAAQEDSKGLKKTQLISSADGTKTVRTANIKPTKAGVSNTRVHVEFGSDDEDEQEPPLDPAEPLRISKAAFDDELSDLAYLRSKAKSTTIDEDRDDEPNKEALSAQVEVDASKLATDKALATSTSKLGKDTSEIIATDETGKQLESATDNRDELEDIELTGRIYVANLPYGATEEELRSHFEPLGEVESVHICKDEDTLKSRGFGYVSFVFPECSVRAIAELDLKSFQGRLLRLTPARQKPPKPEPDETAARGGTSSYKKKLQEKKKKVDAHLEHTWNLLYVSANAAADAATAQLGVAKSALFGKDAENAAVTAALTETSVIQQTKRWLNKEGVRIDAFEQTGPSLAKSRSLDPADTKRREDTFIVKHLPFGSSAPELRERFARFGELARCSLAPSGTVALVQYNDKAAAQRAFQKLAFSRYRHAPLYLEWAPEDIFVAPREADASDEVANKENAANLEAAGSTELDPDEVSRGCLFVKNLNFATTDESLKAAFSKCKGLRSAIVMRKKAAVADGSKKKASGNTKGLSMGYGFLEFDTVEQAQAVLRSHQNNVIDGHAVQLQFSQRGISGGRSEAVSGKKVKNGLTSSRICVRNLAFEATRSELYKLFGAYGSVTSVRIPKKADYSGHRGFAFIDFASRAEAGAAFEALQHTHLYGRRLVIEPAEEKATDVASAQAEAAKRMVSRAQTSEAKRRRRSGILNAPGEATSFEDAMMD
jgi:multiple RNA-binding domain-containing protein 1